MFQPATIWFSLDKDDCVYQCGEKIKGTLGTDIHIPLHIAGIEIRFHGLAQACWRESPYNGRKTSEVEHEKEEIYFDDRFCLWGSINETTGWDSREVLPIGRHVFPFQYRLPANQPTSLECVNGAVRYSMQGLIIVPDGKHISIEQYFTVLRVLDVKKEGLNEVLEDCIERSVTGGCCRTGRIRCSLSLPKRFFVPGEAIAVHVTVDNSSNKKCGSCFVHLNQLVTFGGVHRYSMVIASVEVAISIGCGEHGRWVEMLLVPSTCPTVLDSTQLIVAAYCVSLELDYCDETLHAAVPILVTSQPDVILRNSSWIFKECEPPWSSDDEYSEASDITVGAISKKSHHVSFLPKYKYYCIDNGRLFTRRLNQSPGIKHRYRSSTLTAANTAQYLATSLQRDIHFMSSSQNQLNTLGTKSLSQHNLMTASQMYLHNLTTSQRELDRLTTSNSELFRPEVSDTVSETQA